MVTPVSSPNSPTRTPVSPPPTKPQQTKAAKDAVTPSAKKPALPTKGSFDTVIRTMTRTLPVSVDWEVIGNYVNGYARIRGYVKYIYQGQLVSYALDQNYSHIIDGKLWFSARVLNGTYAAETKVDVQQRKLETIKKVVQALKAAKGKPRSTVLIMGRNVDKLAARLYDAVLSYGVEDIKYGRSLFADRIRKWLTTALDPASVGWVQAQVIASALHELGLNGRRGRPLRVTLRPIEKAGVPKVAGNNTRPLQLLVVDTATLRNAADDVMGTFNQLAVNVWYTLPPKKRTAEYLWGVLRREYDQQEEEHAFGIARFLGRPGYLTAAGLRGRWLGELGAEIAIYWFHFRIANDRTGRQRAVARLRAFLTRLGVTPAAQQAVFAAINATPYVRRNGVVDYLWNLFGFAPDGSNKPSPPPPPSAGAGGSGLAKLAGDFSRRDEL